MAYSTQMPSSMFFSFLKSNTQMPTIYIDADGCPVKDEVYKVAMRYQWPVKVVANKGMNVPLNPLIRMVVVDAGPDVADDYIVQHIEALDICITADIPLADRCLKKDAKALDVRGNEFTHDMIGNAMAMRELMQQLRDSGQISGGPPPFSAKDRSQFLSHLDRMIQTVLRLQSS